MPALDIRNRANAVDAGIPVVVYDSEIPGSHPNCFIGSDWYSMGYHQGEKLGQLINGKGKVACLGLLGLSNQEDGFRGLEFIVSTEMFRFGYDAGRRECQVR